MLPAFNQHFIDKKYFSEEVVEEIIGHHLKEWVCNLCKLLLGKTLPKPYQERHKRKKKKYKRGSRAT